MGRRVTLLALLGPLACGSAVSEVSPAGATDGVATDGPGSTTPGQADPTSTSGGSATAGSGPGTSPPETGSSTGPATTGPSSTTVEPTSGGAGSGEAGSSGGLTTDDPTASGGSTGGTIELCNGMDDDGDGATDEFSEDNTSCLGCQYLTRPGAPSHFYAFCSAAMTFPAGSNHCGQFGGELVSIHDDAENAFVYQNSGGVRTWIGFTDEAVETQWVWADGTDSDYQRWNSGQPNNADSGEHCALMLDSTDRWHDTECANSYPFVCKAPL